MKNKTIIRLFTAALAVALCATAFAVPAFAGGGEGEPYYTETEADLTENDGRQILFQIGSHPYLLILLVSGFFFHLHKFRILSQDP